MLPTTDITVNTNTDRKSWGTTVQPVIVDARPDDRLRVYTDRSTGMWRIWNER